LRLYKGKGCKYCGFTGYKGRVAVAEILNVTSSIKRMVVRKKHSEAIREYAVNSEGFITMKQDGVAKVLAGQTTTEEIMRIV